MRNADVARIDEALTALLPAGSLFSVGGRVRDEVRSASDGIPRDFKDLDYVVVGVSLDELIERLRRGGRADVVGASFAVVKWTLEGHTVDVALPRRERSTGIGHREFEVVTGPDVTLEEDLGRRDFRMNMVARRLPEGELVDPFGGAADIAARRIDIVRPEAFEEDPLRMLRACQFAARFGYTVTEATLAAMRAAAPLVASVSAERVRDELAKLLEQAERPSLGIDLMRASGLLAFVLPEIGEGVGVEQNRYHAYDVYGHSMATLDAAPPGDLTLRLAALLHDVGKPRSKTVYDGIAHFYRHESIGEPMARDLLARLRFPAAQIDDVARLVLHHMYRADPEAKPAMLRRFVRRVGPDLVERQFALRAADNAGKGLPVEPDDPPFEARVRALLIEKPALSVADLQIGGAEVVEMLVRAKRLPPGSRGGREVGEVLKALLERVLDEPALNEPATLRRLAEELAAEL